VSAQVELKASDVPARSFLSSHLVIASCLQLLRHDYFSHPRDGSAPDPQRDNVDILCNVVTLVAMSI
jgi:hypothetical protein